MRAGSSPAGRQQRHIRGRKRTQRSHTLVDGSPACRCAREAAKKPKHPQGDPGLPRAGRSVVRMLERRQDGQTLPWDGDGLQSWGKSHPPIRTRCGRISCRFPRPGREVTIRDKNIGNSAGGARWQDTGRYGHTVEKDGEGGRQCRTELLYRKVQMAAGGAHDDAWTLFPTD